MVSAQVIFEFDGTDEELESVIKQLGGDIEPFAERFDVNQPKVHEGVFWCNECKLPYPTSLGV